MFWRKNKEIQFLKQDLEFYKEMYKTCIIRSNNLEREVQYAREKVDELEEKLKEK